MVGHGGSSAGSYLTNPTSPHPSHCASIVATSTLRVNNCLMTASFVCDGTHSCHHTALNYRDIHVLSRVVEVEITMHYFPSNVGVFKYKYCC